MLQYLFECIRLGFFLITPSTSIFSSNVFHTRAYVLDRITIPSIIESGKQSLHVASLEKFAPVGILNLGQN